MISAIVAVDADWGIGYNGELLERIPEDMKRFKELVTDRMVIVDRKTWDTLPKTHNFLTRNAYLIVSNQYTEPILIIANSHIGYFHLNRIQEFLANHLYENNGYVIIGGASIYKQLLPYCDTIYLTRIDKHHENVDTYFPDFTQTSEWELTECSGIKFHNDIPYQFETWRRHN